jgi:signal transduction histidine kinase
MLPFLISSVVLLTVIVVAHRQTKPVEPAIIQVEARPDEQPTDWTRWVDDAPDAWLPFELPIKACKVRCKTPYTAWRYRFDAVPTLQDPAVWFRQADANAAFYLNGTLIEMKGRMENPPSVYRYHARLVRLPRNLLKPTGNELAWRLTIQRSGTGGVNEFYLGEYASLEIPDRASRRLSHDSVMGAFWWQLGTLLFACGLWLRQYKQPVLQWFLAAGPFWLTLSVTHLFPDAVQHVALRSMVFYISMAGLLAFSALFMQSLLEQPKRWMRRLAFGYFGAVCILTVLASVWPNMDDYWRIAIPHFTVKYSAYLLLPVILLFLGRYLRAQRANRMASWVFAAAAFPALCGLHDMSVGTATQGLMNYVLTPAAGVGISLAFLLEMGRRVLGNQIAMARYNEQLEATVQEKEIELRGNYERLRQADKDRALADERARIMRDMHDGVGGQLAALVHLANDDSIGRGEIVDAVRVGLADLRLVLDSLNQTDGDLLMALGTFRERGSALFRSAGITLFWQQAPSLQADGFGPESVLQVFRILQECFTNIVRHSRAKTVRVRVAGEAGDLVLQVEDDGIGFDTSGQSSGRYGLNGMRYRAQQIGAGLEVQSIPVAASPPSPEPAMATTAAPVIAHGTRMTLRIPNSRDGRHVPS